MNLPDEFSLPEDHGELMAWLKNFATKLPQYASKLELSPEMLAEVQNTYEQMRAAKEADDGRRLQAVERRLCAVPDAWPPPPVLFELMHKIKEIEEPVRTRMMEEIERWTRGIELARSPHIAPVLRGDTFDEGLIVRFTPLPKPCAWARIYWRREGEAAWGLLAIVSHDYHLYTRPDPADGDAPIEGVLEFIAIGQPAGEDLLKSDPYGAPSAVLTMTVPKTDAPPAAEW